jgi:hypothetical protein
MLLRVQPMCACMCIRTYVCTWMRATWFSHLQNFVVWTLDKFKDYMVLLLMVHETCVMMWWAHSTLMPWCLQIRWSVTKQSHCNIWSTLAHVTVCKVGWTTRVCQVLSGAPTVFEPLSPIKHCCSLQTVVTLPVLHSRMNEWMNKCWSCTFRAQKLNDTVFRVSGWIHDYSTEQRCCAKITQSSLFMMCGCNGQKND